MPMLKIASFNENWRNRPGGFDSLHPLHSASTTCTQLQEECRKLYGSSNLIFHRVAQPNLAGRIRKLNLFERRRNKTGADD